MNFDKYFIYVVTTIYQNFVNSTTIKYNNIVGCNYRFKGSVGTVQEVIFTINAAASKNTKERKLKENYGPPNKK